MKRIKSHDNMTSVFSDRIKLEFRVAGTQQLWIFELEILNTYILILASYMHKLQLHTYMRKHILFKKYVCWQEVQFFQTFFKPWITFFFAFIEMLPSWMQKWMCDFAYSMLFYVCIYNFSCFLIINQEILHIQC